MTKPTSLIQIVLFAKESNFLEYGPAVWSALKEVELLYGRAGRIDKCQRFVFDPEGPPTLQAEWPAFDNNPPNRRQLDFWSSVRGRFFRTVDQKIIRNKVREALSPMDIEGHILVVTDQEITPPPEWRYILWDTVGNDAIISTAPMDPLYWRLSGGDRVAIIKQRLRAAAMSATGELLEFKRCENGSCYLFEAVGAVSVLDSMVLFGKEHGIDSLTGLGFDPRPTNPRDVQDLVYPMPDGR